MSNEARNTLAIISSLITCICIVTVEGNLGDQIPGIFWTGNMGKTVVDITADEPVPCTDSNPNWFGQCLEWNEKLRLRVHQVLNDTSDVNCTVVSWEALDCTVDSFEDCLDLTGANWYGGAVVKLFYWPIELQSEWSRPYVLGDSIATPPGYGGVQERYWVNSNGTAVQIDWDIPLWVSINSTGDKKLCLRAQYRNSPYNNYDDSQVALKYTVCQGRDVRHIHDYMVATYLQKPTDIPDEKLFRYPIWSTWAQYKTNISQNLVIEFATAIINNGFSNSQLEVDDKWEVNYGDLDFDLEKFPDPRAMVDTLTSMGFRTTLWTHPFVSLQSSAIQEGMGRFAFVTDPGRTLPALTSWWAESSAMTNDFTASRGQDWFVERLNALRLQYNISSFKLDAGETNWLPNSYALRSRNERNPSVYSAYFARTALAVDPDVRHQEIRVGSQTQDLPIFVRMLDKDSRWGYNNGIATIIPHALNVGIIGYPFILPDMVGGNAYGQLPDRELFIRWTELNVFLPSIQFSIVPWQYDDELIEITKNMTKLHESYAQTLIDLARESTVTGAPIIRPLWWIAPTDEVALSIDSEFLVGNDILVAPIVQENARSRDIYLPSGMWLDELRKVIVTGGQWLLNYTVELHELAYFTRTEANQLQ